jgi:hypothetical protein
LDDWDRAEELWRSAPKLVITSILLGNIVCIQ